MLVTGPGSLAEPGPEHRFPDCQSTHCSFMWNIIFAAEKNSAGLWEAPLKRFSWKWVLPNVHFEKCDIC